MADPKKSRRGQRTRMSTAEFADRMRIHSISKRVELNSLGELTNPKGEVYYMNDSELRSAEMILSRAIPKLTSQSLVVDGNLEVTKIERNIVDPKSSK